MFNGESALAIISMARASKFPNTLSSPEFWMLLAGTRIVCGEASEGMERPLFVWTPCLQQAP